MKQIVEEEFGKQVSKLIKLEPSHDNEGGDLRGGRERPWNDCS